jgi:hypothetical protein
MNASGPPSPTPRREQTIRKAYAMPIPTMDAHMRAGVLRCDGCWSAATLELSTTPSALTDAKRLVARVLPAWGITAEHIDAAQTVTRSLVQAAVRVETVAMVAFALVRHADGIIVEICEAVTWSPDVVMLLSLPQPSGLHWCHDAQGQLCSRLLWCGVRTPQAYPTQRVPSAGATQHGRFKIAWSRQWISELHMVPLGGQRGDRVGAGTAAGR